MCLGPLPPVLSPGTTEKQSGLTFFIPSTDAWCNSFPDAGLPYVELHELPTGLFLQSVRVPLNSNITTLCITHSSTFRIIGKLTADVCCPIVQVIKEEGKW